MYFLFAKKIIFCELTEAATGSGGESERTHTVHAKNDQIETILKWSLENKMNSLAAGGQKAAL